MNQVSQGKNDNVQSGAGEQDSCINEQEFNLIDIFLVLSRRKKIIAAVAIGVMLVVFAYGQFAERVYQAETVVVRPMFDELVTLNMNNRQAHLLIGPVLTEEDLGKVYDSFVDNIRTRNAVKSYFSAHDIFQAVAGKTNKNVADDEFDLVFNDFYQQLKVNKNKGVTNISLEGANKKMVGPWLVGLVDFVNKETVKAYIKKLKANVYLKIDVINTEIANRRKLIKKKLEDKIIRKQEEYHIAKELGMDKTVITQFSDEYLKGMKLLQAEIDALKKRVQTDVYISDIPSLLVQKQALESIVFDGIKLTAVMVRKNAGEYVELIKPKVRWMLAIVLGLMLGVVVAFIAELISAIEKRKNSIA